MSILPILRLLKDELFPAEVRATASGLVMAIGTLVTMTNVKIFPMTVAYFGFHYVVYFYAIITALLAVWGSLTIKNTDQLSLTEIQDMHKKAEAADQALNDGKCRVNPLEVTELGNVTKEMEGKDNEMEMTRL